LHVRHLASDRLLRTAAIILGIISVPLGLTCVGLVCAHIAVTREHNQRYLHERNLLAPVLASDPAFADVKIEMDTLHGGIYLVGSVKVSALDRFRAELVRLFGEPRAKVLLSGGFFGTHLDVPAPKPK
jgi:hypothetical protein